MKQMLINVELIRPIVKQLLLTNETKLNTIIDDIVKNQTLLNALLYGKPMAVNYDAAFIDELKQQWSDNIIDISGVHLVKGTKFEVEVIMERLMWYATEDDANNNKNGRSWKNDGYSVSRKVVEKDINTWNVYDHPFESVHITFE